MVAFAATTDLDRARFFYGEVLGLELVDDTPIAVVFEAGGTAIRVALVEERVAVPYTVIGFVVDDIAETVDELVERGVVFRRFPGMDQDDRGTWSPPGGGHVAWFDDPDGNVLSLTEPPR